MEVLVPDLRCVKEMPNLSSTNETFLRTTSTTRRSPVAAPTHPTESGSQGAAIFSGFGSRVQGTESGSQCTVILRNCSLCLLLASCKFVSGALAAQQK